MSAPIDFNGRPFHFIGIGGIGMSALAGILAERGLPVSGSDMRSTTITAHLQQQGAQVFQGHDAAHLQYFLQPNFTSADAQEKAQAMSIVDQKSGDLQSKKLPQVICSTAINSTNPEYQAALEMGCPLYHRSDVLAALIQDYRSIAVSGTHGKTTTSSLIGHLFWAADLDPTAIIGGEVASLGGNARLGHGTYLVAEADESDGSLVKHKPWIGVITNIELDHPDHYQSLEQVVEIFRIFANQCQIMIGCIDCPTVREHFQPTVTYGLNPTLGADYTADRITYHGKGVTARIWEHGQILGQLELPLLGAHNLQNALATIAVGRQAGLEFPAIAQALTTFEGARRRFEIRGEHHGIRFVDDYAHHPSEIQVTLEAAQQQSKTIAPTASQHRVIAIFQPHRFSRTETFLAEFSQSFQKADLVVISDIYSAGEADTGRIDGEKVANAISRYHANVYYQPSLQSVAAFLKETLQAGDTAIFLGAGNLNQTIPDVMAYYQHHGADVSQAVSSQQG
jgi:UDP-N-acetylmuramate--alanine ligase